MLPVTTPYAALLALLLVWLSANVILARLRGKVSVGDGGDKTVLKAMRLQANCAEYAPMGIILLALAELQGAPGVALHVLGLTLLIGRLMHAVGFGRTPQIVSMRRIGVVLTFTMLIATALGLLLHALF